MSCSLLKPYIWVLILSLGVSGPSLPNLTCPCQEEDELPDDDLINRYIERSPAEYTLFTQMDQVRVRKS